MEGDKFKSFSEQVISDLNRLLVTNNNIPDVTEYIDGSYTQSEELRPIFLFQRFKREFDNLLDQASNANALEKVMGCIDNVILEERALWLKIEKIVLMLRLIIKTPMLRIIYPRSVIVDIAHLSQISIEDRGQKECRDAVEEIAKLLDSEVYIAANW